MTRPGTTSTATRLRSLAVVFAAEDPLASWNDPGHGYACTRRGHANDRNPHREMISLPDFTLPLDVVTATRPACARP